MKKILLYIIILSCTSFSQNERSIPRPYALSWNTDGWILGASAVAGGAAYYIETNLSPLTSTELQSLDRNSINAIDRGIAGTYNESFSNISDALAGIAIVSPLSLLLDEGIREDYFTLGVMYAETAVLSAIAPSLGKGITKRIRPYAYGNSAPIEVRTESDAQRSFFSRHTTFAFSMAVFASTVYSDYFPSSEYKTHVWIASLGLAASCAVFRVTSGSHFPTDVIVGAAVGSSVGYLIPYIHRNPSNNLTLVPLITPHSNGILFTVRF